MRVAVAAESGQAGTRKLEQTHGIRRYACDASDPAAVETLFQKVTADLGAAATVVHNIDGRVPGIFRKGNYRSRSGDGARRCATRRSARFSSRNRPPG
jgi:NAD(P)-dependent dehydrogenase (short-subunit alcohol dehydrogenase family)